MTNTSKVSMAKVEPPPKPAATVNIPLVSSEVFTPPRDGKSECPHDKVVCSIISDPTVCKAAIYNKRKLEGEEVFRGWGDNACEAKQDLAREACRRNLKPSLISQISCSPDPSSGNCPPKTAACAMDYAPAICLAKRYGTEDLSESQQIEARGSNVCNARAALMQEACNKKLNPTQLDDIVCRPDIG